MFKYLIAIAVVVTSAVFGHHSHDTTYDASLQINPEPRPILDGLIDDTNRFVARPLIDEGGLVVRSWRYSYNARGIIEMVNRLDGDKTALIVVHPWGIDDGQGWQSPEPAGVAFFGTPEKNRIARQHTENVLKPFVDRLRPDISLVGYSLLGSPDERTSLYRSPGNDNPNGISDLSRLQMFNYQAGSLPPSLALTQPIVSSYLAQFPGLSANDHYNGPGYWRLPVPVYSGLYQSSDLVFYEDQGYGALRDYLIERNIEHVLLAGYATADCVLSTAAGADTLQNDFNVFVVGDATVALFPAMLDPTAATAVEVAKISIDHLVTQTDWITATP